MRFKKNEVRIYKIIGKSALKWKLILDFQAQFILENRSAMPREEVLLRSLYELSSGNTRYDISQRFGREESAKSRAFKNLIDFCYNSYNNFRHLMQDNLTLVGKIFFLARSAIAIGKKKE